MTWAHHSLIEGDRKGLIQGLTLTVLLGISFTSRAGLRVRARRVQLPLRPGVPGAGGIYPSTFFMATGFHGFHVIVGTIFLAVCLWRA